MPEGDASTLVTVTPERPAQSVEYARPDYFPPPGQRFTGWWFLLAQVPVFVVILLSRVAQKPPAGVTQPLAAIVAVGGYGFILGVLFLASRLRGVGTLKHDYGWDIRPVDLLWGVLGVVVTVFVGLLIASAVRAFGVPSTNVRLGDDRLWNVVNVFLVPVLVAAPIEELAFRGLLMRWIRNAVLRRRAAATMGGRDLAVHLSVALSALCFAMFHLYQVADFPSALNLGLQTLTIGIVNGYLATYTGRLGAAVLAHGLHNALVGVVALSG